MKKILSDQERSRLDGLITKTEKQTKTQIVLAVIKRCDNYAELPWKAFALGIALVCLLIFVFGMPEYDWNPRVTVILATLKVLFFGAVFAFLAVLIPRFARLFLPANRAETEVRQYAESIFLERELFATKNRTGILILVSLFERKIIILPDKGLTNQLEEESLQSVMAAMIHSLKSRKVVDAFEAGLERLSQILGTSVKGTGENELPDEIIEEKGV